jgi:guanylate kinase
MTASSYCFALLGPSGVGKSTILRYLERAIHAEAAPKYTTRPSRGTPDDNRDFIFCSADEIPTTGTLRFDSYGHVFAIQLDRIADSLARGRSHVLTVDSARTVEELQKVFSGRLVTILVYCVSEILRARIFSVTEPHRRERWPYVALELSSIYDELGCVTFVVNNSHTEARTYQQVNRILDMLRATTVDFPATV